MVSWHTEWSTWFSEDLIFPICLQILIGLNKSNNSIDISTVLSEKSNNTLTYKSLKIHIDKKEYGGLFWAQTTEKHRLKIRNQIDLRKGLLNSSLFLLILNVTNRNHRG